MAGEKTENVLSEELAENEFSKWTDENDINVNTAGMNEQEAISFNLMKTRIIKAISKGLLIVNDNGNFEYTVSSRSPNGYAGDKVEILPPDGKAYMAVDNFKKDQNVHKSMAILSAMTGKDVSWFSKLANCDYKLFDAVVTFFITD